MRLRTKLSYISVGFQSCAAILFAMVGKLLPALMSVFFAIWGWNAAEFYANQKEEDNAIPPEEDR